MARVGLTLALMAVIALCFWGMYRSWQRRIERTSDRSELSTVGSATTIRHISHATYLGTVTGSHWLDRIASHGLGGRGPAALTVFVDGLRIERVGQAQPVDLASRVFVDVELASGLAGRTFGKESVIVVSWRWDDEVVHTGIRVADGELRKALLVDLTGMCPTKTARTA